MNRGLEESGSSAARRVLVVDDDELLRETVKELLEMEGFAVSTAENGLEALESLTELGPPCFVLLDLMMPVMDGSTFLERIRHDPRPAWDRLPVVVFSALTEASTLAARYACEVLPKPVTMDRLIETADRLCPRAA